MYIWLDKEVAIVWAIAAIALMVARGVKWERAKAGDAEITSVSSDGGGYTFKEK